MTQTYVVASQDELPNSVNKNQPFNVRIPEGVTKIEESAFYECRGLTKVTIPDTVTEIGDSAFQLLELDSVASATFSGLTEINIPESVTRIGDCAFCCCSGLKEINIPDGVTEIGETAFWRCSGLTEITIPEGVTHFAWSAFEGCKGLKEITIPETVTHIGNSAFEECSNLTEIAIPEGVTKIGETAFAKCTNLKRVLMNSSTHLGQDVFSFCPSLDTIIVLKNSAPFLAGKMFHPDDPANEYALTLQNHPNLKIVAVVDEKKKDLRDLTEFPTTLVLRHHVDYAPMYSPHWLQPYVLTPAQKEWITLMKLIFERARATRSQYSVPVEIQAHIIAAVKIRGDNGISYRFHPLES